METIKLTEEQKDQLSMTDVAKLILVENKGKMKIQDLFMQVIKSLELPESYFESKIGDFFGLLSTDKRFIMIDKGFWDLRDNHSSKIKIDVEDEEDDEVLEVEDEEETIEDEEEDNNDVNYDDELTDDDEEEDAYKDLVIVDESEEESDVM